MSIALPDGTEIHPTFTFSDKPFRPMRWWRHPIRKWRMRHVEVSVFGPLDEG